MTLQWTVLYFLASTVSCLNINVGLFKVSERHEELKKCAARILPENANSGGRVSRLTGKCEGLQQSWGSNEEKESGYTYAKKMFVQNKFVPPIDDFPFDFKVPGVLQPGSKLDLFVSMEGQDESFTVKLVDTADNSTQPNFVVFLRVSDNNVVFGDNVVDNGFSYGPSSIELNPTVSSREMLKLSFHFQDKSIKVLADGEDIVTRDIGRSVDQIKRLVVEHPKDEPGSVRIHSIRFTAK